MVHLRHLATKGPPCICIQNVLISKLNAPLVFKDSIKIFDKVDPPPSLTMLPDIMYSVHVLYFIK